MKFSVCMDALFKGSDSERIELCSKAGAKAIEFWAWWEKDVDLVKKAAAENNLEIAAMCTKFFSLTDPAQRDDYKAGLKASLEAADKLGCKVLISQTGNDTGKERQLQRESIIEGLRECIPLLEKTNVTLAVEPLNTRIDHKGYFLSSSAEAFEIINRLSSPHIKVLYDIYHQQITEGNIVNNVKANIGNICHFHCAGISGRGELTNGELNYPFVFGEIDKTGYTGFMGLEYFPKEEALSNLKKILEDYGS